jgi:DNA-binding response OmpR family regulator
MAVAAPTLVGDLEIWPGEYQVLVSGRRANLTIREFELFWALAQRADRVVSREELHRLVWGREYRRRDRSTDVCVRKVRLKLSAVSPGTSYIHTHFGVGYRFSVPEPA